MVPKPFQRATKREQSYLRFLPLAVHDGGGNSETGLKARSECSSFFLRAASHTVKIGHCGTHYIAHCTAHFGNLILPLLPFLASLLLPYFTPSELVASRGKSKLFTGGMDAAPEQTD